MITHSARITRLQARIKFELPQKRRGGEKVAQHVARNSSRK